MGMVVVAGLIDTGLWGVGFDGMAWCSMVLVGRSAQ